MMFGRLLPALYASPSLRVPRVATIMNARIRPVARDAIVPIAIRREDLPTLGAGASAGRGGATGRSRTPVSHGAAPGSRVVGPEPAGPPGWRVAGPWTRPRRGGMSASRLPGFARRVETGIDGIGERSQRVALTASS